MRTRIIWLVAASTSAIVVAFVVPLCLLVANVARGRALDRANEQAQNVATLMVSVDNPAALERSVDGLSSDGPTVLIARADGTVVGADEVPPDSQADVAKARDTTSSFVAETASGVDVVVPVITEDGTHIVLAIATNDQLRAGVNRAWATLIALGLLLVVVMTINMVLALLLVPLLVYLFNPRFISAEHHLLSESVDGLLDHRDPATPPGPDQSIAVSNP
mgnify:CR=1 FL=1